MDVSDGDKLPDMFSVLDLAGSLTSSLLSSDPLPEGDNGTSSRDSGIGVDDQGVNWDEEEKKGTAIEPELQHNKQGSISSTRSASNVTPTILGKRKVKTNPRQVELSGSRPVSSARQNPAKYRIQVYADGEPLVAGDDEDDELLLTSKGWDWDPLCVVLLSWRPDIHHSSFPAVVPVLTEEMIHLFDFLIH
jgi:hypothetical protein